MAMADLASRFPVTRLQEKDESAGDTGGLERRERRGTSAGTSTMKS